MTSLENSPPVTSAQAHEQQETIKHVMESHKVDFAEAVNLLIGGTQVDTPRDPALKSLDPADYEELLEILDDQGREGDGTSKSAARVIRSLAQAAAPPSPDTVREALVRALIDDDHFGTEASSQEVLEAYAQGSSLVIMGAITAALSSAPVVGAWQERTILDLERTLREVRRALDPERDPTAMQFPRLRVEVVRALQISENARVLSRKDCDTPDVV